MEPALPDPKKRFSDRVADYVRYRPGYPPELIRTLQTEGGLSAADVVADIGAGTGISSEPFVGLGCEVHAVEPNAEMRHAAEDWLGRYANFRSVAGSAEDTTLPAGSVDWVVAGQAFHWFKAEPARREFARILRPRGGLAIFWNTRRTTDTPFLRGYEELLQRHSPDYRRVDHRNVGPERLRAFFAGGEPRRRVFPNSQSFDFAALRGRLLSSSYAPAPGRPGHAEMMESLEQLFSQHAEAGQVRFLYDVELYFGALAA